MSDADTALSEVSPPVEPDGPSAGSATGCQEVPSQCSTRGWLLPAPAAQAFVAPKSTTPDSRSSRPDVGGVATIDHAVPFQWNAIVRVPRLLMTRVYPTAQASAAPLALTASAVSSKCSTPGAGTRVHVMPFQRSASMSNPASSAGFAHRPTAHPSVAV